MLVFDQRKLTEAAAVLLRDAAGHRMNYMRLIKLLYLAERKSLEKRGLPLFGDTAYAMKCGPVLSKTYDLIKGSDPGIANWARHFRTDNYELVMDVDPGLARLSRAEVSLLKEVERQFAGDGEFEIVDWCHEHVQEFKDNDPGSFGRKRIPLADILKAVGREGQEEAVQAHVRESAAASVFFRAHGLDD